MVDKLACGTNLLFCLFDSIKREKQEEEETNKSIYFMVFVFLFFGYKGGSPLIYSPAPRGDCQNCCPIREPRDIKFMLYTR